MLCVFMWLRAHLLCMLRCLRVWRVCVLTCLVCLRVCVLACYDEMFYFLTCLRTWCAFLCALLSWTYSLFTFWYQLIKLYETNLRAAGKSIDISYSYSCSIAISIFYNLYIHLHLFFINNQKFKQLPRKSLIC